MDAWRSMIGTLKRLVMVRGALRRCSVHSNKLANQVVHRGTVVVDVFRDVCLDCLQFRSAFSITEDVLS